MTWTERMLTANGFRVLESQKVPIVYSAESVRRQLNVASRKLPSFKSQALANAMKEVSGKGVGVHAVAQMGNRDSPPKNSFVLCARLWLAAHCGY